MRKFQINTRKIRYTAIVMQTSSINTKDVKNVLQVALHGADE